MLLLLLLFWDRSLDCVQPVIRAFVLASPDDDGSPPRLRFAFCITKEAISCAWCDEIGGDARSARLGRKPRASCTS